MSFRNLTILQLTINNMLKAKTERKILMVVEILVGGFFLLNAATDIQIGFGLVLLFMGLNLSLRDEKK